MVGIVLLLASCSEDSGIETSNVADYTTVKYDYVWPSNLDGYKIRFRDTVFNREHRLFQEYLQDGYDHAYVLDFTVTDGFENYEVYGYEDDNAKYTSTGYFNNMMGIEDDKEVLVLYTSYSYVDGVEQSGSDRYELYPTSATGGTYMSWGEYPGSTPLYNAKTGVYELVVDPTD